MIYRKYWDKTNLKETSKKYNETISSIYKIVNDFKAKDLNYSFFKTAANTDNFLSLEEQYFIKNYAKPPQIPLTIQNINEEVNKVFEVKWKKRKIKSFFKNLLNYSYKKGSAMIIKGTSSKTSYNQAIFSWKSLNEIKRRKLMINIDEWSF